jgi:hypothetical protein
MLLFKNPKMGIVALILVFIGGCSYSETFKIQQSSTNDKATSYQIALPDYLDNLLEHHLHRTASVQYGNFFRNTYVIVVDTLSSEQFSLQQYAQQNIQQLVATLERPQKVDSTALQIDEKNALRVAYTGTVGIKKIKERIYYQLVFVEGEKHYYQIVLWTWDQWRQKYQADFEHIVQSFKEQ